MVAPEAAFRARDTCQGHSRPSLEQSLFSSVVYPSDGKTMTTAAPGYMPAVDVELSPSPPVNVPQPELTTDSGHQSQTEVAQGASDKSGANIERIESLILEQDQH